MLQRHSRLLVPAAFASLFAAGLIFAHPARVQGEVKVEAHAVAGSVHYIEGMGGNIGVCAGDDGVLVIDDQMKEVEPRVLAAIEGISKAPWRFVLNTHFHGDHTGNNADFGRKAPIIAQKNVRIRLMDPKSQNGAAPAAALPVLTYDDGIALFLNGEEIRVKHFDGGHTDGDSVVFFTGSNVVHMGDLFFNGLFPFVDLDSGGSVQKLVADLDQIIPTLKSDVKVIPGHGPLGTLDDLKNYRAMLADCVELVRAGIKSGKSTADLQKAHVLKKYEKFAWQFVNEERFVATVARDLGAK